jgi:hypothetical protein
LPESLFHGCGLLGFINIQFTSNVDLFTIGLAQYFQCIGGHINMVFHFSTGPITTIYKKLDKNN